MNCFVLHDKVTLLVNEVDFTEHVLWYNFMKHVVWYIFAYNLLLRSRYAQQLCNDSIALNLTALNFAVIKLHD
jgi:hypothetical protein